MQFRQCSIGDTHYIEQGGRLCLKSDIPGNQPELIDTFTVRK